MKNKSAEPMNMDDWKQLQALISKLEAAVKPLKRQQKHRLFKKRSCAGQTTTATGDNAVEKKMSRPLPAVLATPLAMALWQKAKENEWVDECCQPLVTHGQAALLAERMAQLLDIRCKWLVFGTFWHINNLKSYRVRALNQHGSGDFMLQLNQLNRIAKTF